MTVNITKPAINLREELASLRNQGGYSEQQFYFDGLVTNGTFDTATTGWTASDAGCSLSLVSNQLRITNNDATAGGATTPISVVAGKLYTFSVGTSSGGVQLYLGASANQATYFGPITANSTTWTSTVTATVYFMIKNTSTTNGATIDIDNVSVFEVDANDDVIHRMPKGWKPKDVFEDGLLQREGAANDYTVVYDDFYYVVKPTVAPSATTQTCVIGVRA